MNLPVLKKHCRPFGEGRIPSGSFPQFAQNRRSLATLDKMIPFVDTPSTIGAGSRGTTR
jgi:hypothetical protein